MPIEQHITVHLTNGTSHTFTVSDGNGDVHAVSIETSGYGLRPEPGAPMIWYTAADVDRVEVESAQTTPA